MNERACYRIGRDAGLDAFALSLALPDGRTVPARLCDTSARGLAIETCDEALWLRPGVQMTVHIALPGHGRDIAVPVIVRGVRQPGRRFGVEVCDPEQLERELPPELFKLFNRRQTPRTFVDPDEYIPFKLSSGGGRRAVGRMRDISVAGASLELPLRDDPAFAAGEPVQIALQMRHRQRALEVAGHIRRVQKTRRNVIYGIEFDAETCPTTLRHHRALEQLMSEITLVEQSNPGARIVAERRAAKRARPNEEVTLSIELRGKGDRRATSVLRDISITGLGVIVPAADDPEFAADEEMELTLQLPHDSLDLVAKIRRGLLIDSQVCYGLEFDTAHSDNASCSALRTFVELLLLDDDSPTGKLIAQISGSTAPAT
jgi:hypothetical protein